jgi:hypothetical protein
LLPFKILLQSAGGHPSQGGPTAFFFNQPNPAPVCGCDASSGAHASPSGLSNDGYGAEI